MIKERRVYDHDLGWVTIEPPAPEPHQADYSPVWIFITVMIVFLAIIAIAFYLG